MKIRTTALAVLLLMPFAARAESVSRMGLFVADASASTLCH